VEISKISKSGKGTIGRPKKNENIIVHCVVNTNAVRNGEITLNENEHDGKFIFASNDLNLDSGKKCCIATRNRVRWEMDICNGQKFPDLGDLFQKKSQRIEELSMIMV